MKKSNSAHACHGKDGGRVRVEIVDDHGVVREGLHMLLDACPSVRVVGEAADAGEALEIARREQPEVLLLDWRLKEGDAAPLCAGIRALRPAIKILVLSAYPDRASMEAAFKAGVQGFLAKDIDGEALCDAIHRVMAGETVVDPRLAAILVAPLRPASDRSPSEKLSLISPQEFRVMEQVAAGKTNKEIAADLALSDQTVKHYLGNLMRKMGVKRRAQVAAFFIRHHGAVASPPVGPE